MKKKKDRLGLIAQIVEHQTICSQEDLLKVLSEKGIELTQATLSRDLKALKISRAIDNDGRYVYVLPGSQMPDRNFAASGTENEAVSFSGNLAVVKTRSGYAGGVASEIDQLSFEHILGTIAGDDTILVILKENANREAVRIFLSKLINKE